MVSIEHIHINNEVKNMSDVKILKSIDITSYTIMGTVIGVLFSVLFPIILLIAIGI